MKQVLFFLILILHLGCESNKEVTKRATTSYKYLALGDSYTIGESVSESGRWPAQLKDSLESRGQEFSSYELIATTGWRTDDLANAMNKADLKNEYNLVSLLIGVNNQYQGRSVEDYKPEFEALLNRAVELAGGEKDNVFVVSIPDYAFTPFGQRGNSAKISNELAVYNEACKNITLANDIRHVDITPISFRGVDQPNLVASDGLHPSADQYTLWVKEILDQIF